LLEWDTAFWGLPVARVEGDVMTEARRAEVDEWCRDNGIRCLYFLARTDDPQTTLAAERGGFFYTDVRITLGQSLAPRDRLQPGAAIRDATSSDREELAAIARVSHDVTRFYHDPHFPNDRCGELYAEWILSSCNGGADAVLVADVHDRAAGYVSCQLENETIGQIGLIAVAPGSRGRGLGARLVAAALDRFVVARATEAVVVTQARNIAALRLFERAGYAVTETELWFHKWYDR
jgi:dTDP-4-amino-4,6-dideoxy-D-galactose acyltransferase